MRENKDISRIDILTLDLKTIKAAISPGKHIELAVSENGVNISDLDRSLKSWVLSTPHQISFSRNKIGKPLLKQHRNGFILDDPYMFHSRFFVEYHRLQDPALKRYFDSSSVRNRLKELNLVNEEDDVICTKKEFAEYLRYLERVRARNIVDSIRNTVRKFCLVNFVLIAWNIYDFLLSLQREAELAEDLKKLKETKQYESQFTGIFRRKRYTSEPKSLSHLNKY